MIQTLSCSWLSFLVAICLTLSSPRSARAEFPSSNSPLAGLDLERYAVRHWTVTDGLPPGQIQALCQTRDGYLWIGTRHGLSRFDGLQFQTVPQLNCISLAEDEDGVLWIGTQHGLYQAVKGHVNVFSIQPPPKSTEGRYIWAICAAKGGGVWVQDSDSLVLIKGNQAQRIFGAQVGKNRARALCVDEVGRLWMAGSSSPFRYDPRASKVEQWPGLPQSFNTKPISSFMRDRSGALWLGGSLVNVHRLKDGEVTEFRSAEGSNFAGYNSVVEDEIGTIWAGSFGGIGQVISGEVRKVEALKACNFGSHPVLFPNFEGGLWVGTGKDGLYLVQRKAVAALTETEGLVHNDVWSIAEDKAGAMWIGTFKGLSRLSQGHFSHYTKSDGLKGSHAASIAVDKVGHLWVGTHGGLTDEFGALHLLESNRFTNLEKALGFVPANVSWLTPAPDDTVWITADNGLSQWKEGNMLINALKVRQVTSTLVDHNNRLWLGGRRVGYHQDNAIHWFDQTDGLKPGHYGPVHEDEENAVWLLTPDKGIFRYKDGRFAGVSTKQGLFSDLNLSLLDDGLGRYWFNCYKGIYWVQKAELNAVLDGKKDRVTCVSYGLEDGLPGLEGNGGNSPNACRASDGRLWFPTTRGVAIVDPKATLQDNKAPPVLIEEVRCDGEMLRSTTPMLGARLEDESSEFKIPAGRGRSLVISYAAPSFIAPEKTRYRYRLEGQDRGWIDAQGQTFVQFAGLKPGRYRFHVTACNYRGVWNPIGAELAFSIAPFFYETWAFYGICGAVVLGLGGGIQAFRLSMQRRILGLEREAALARERERIARDMHDDLGASLTRIARLSELAREQINAGEQGRGSIEKISRSASEVVDSIGELVWATNPKYDHLESMTAYFREYAAQHFEDSGTACHCDFPEHVSVVPVTADFRRQLFLVLKEALQNVAKHAQAKDVWVKLEILEDQLRIEVRDNGKGMDCKESPAFHHGLTNMRERMKSIGGTLELLSTPGQGTTVIATAKYQL